MKPLEPTPGQTDEQFERSFREWQREEQAARQSMHYDKKITPELAAKLDAALLKLGIRPPKKGARV